MKKLIVVVCILLIAVFFFKDMLIKFILIKGVNRISGLNLQIESMKVGITRPVIEIKNLELFNPAGFPEQLMVQLPGFYLDYEPLAFLNGKVHIKLLRLNLLQFVVVKNQKGVLNLDSLKAFQAKGEKKEKGKPSEFLIEQLELKIGKVVYKDYSKGLTPKVTEFNLDIDAKYNNISNPSTLVSLIVVRALMNTTISSLANFDLSPLTNILNQHFGGNFISAKDAADKVLDVGQKLGIKAFGEIEGALDSTVDKFNKIIPLDKKE